VSASRINKNFRESAEVVLNNELISRNPPVAEIMFEVGPIEEVVREIKLRTSKVAWGVEFDRDSVSCTFLIPQKDHERVLAEGPSVYLYLAPGEMKKGESKSFLPSLKGLPPYAELLHVDSVKVKKY
jgi:hypothetical protein